MTWLTNAWQAILMLPPLAATSWAIQVPVIIGLSICACVVTHIWLTWRNAQTGTRFETHVWPELKEGNMAVAVYYGVRVAAVVYLVATVFSRFA